MSIDALTKLQSDLGNFNADSASMIKEYWPETTMKINLIFAMMNLRDRLENESNPKLNKALKQIKSDFVDYIGKKINGDQTSDKDDLFFEIREIASLQLGEASSVVIEDIKKSTLPPKLKESLIHAFQNNQYSEALRIISQDH